MISVVIPAYNEEAHIENTLKVVLETLESIKNPINDFELIVVDNGSMDKTSEVVEYFSKKDPRVKFIKIEEKGKGLALKEGSLVANGKYICFLDADLDLEPWHIKHFFEIMETSNADIVIGSKRHPLSKVEGYPLSRRILSYCYQIMNKILFNLDVRDTQVGLKLFKAEVLKDVLPRILCKRYAFDLEILVNAKNLGYTIVEAPINLKWKREHNRIKIRDIWNIFIDTMAIFYRLKILKFYDRKVS